MTTKRVSFDLMNLGCPVHTDPFEVHYVDTEDSVVTGIYPNFFLPEELLKTKLAEEAKNMHSDFFIRDPSSSDESDDYAFPETINEQVRRLSFAKRRKQHYTEFATVELARRLVCAEFASVTSSLKSEDSDFRVEEEECPPCWPQSTESTFPFVKYDPPKEILVESEDSGLKEDLEPGFNPSHHCYHKLVGTLSLPSLGAANQPSEGGFNQPVITMAEVNKELHESLERHTRVVNRSEKFDPQPAQVHPLMPEPGPETEPETEPKTVPQIPKKGSRVQGSVRSEKLGKPVGFRSV